jgi:hypothetical protein
MNTFIKLIIPVWAISNMHSIIYFRVDFVLITVGARLDAVYWRWARKGVGVGNVRCRDGLPGVVGLPGLAGLVGLAL